MMYRLARPRLCLTSLLFLIFCGQVFAGKQVNYNGTVGECKTDDASACAAWSDSSYHGVWEASHSRCRLAFNSDGSWATFPKDLPRENCELSCTSEQFNAAVEELQTSAPNGAVNTGSGWQFTYSDTYQIDPEGVTVQTGPRASYSCRNSCRQQQIVDVVASSVSVTSYTLTDITTTQMLAQSCSDMPPDTDERTDQFIAGGGTPDKPEKDTDNDGVPDSKDNDIDGDGIENNADADQDGDGVNDKADKDGDGITDSHDGDIDGDGIANGSDSDADGDGIANGDDPTPHGGGSGPDKGDEEGDKGSGTATNCDQPPTSEGDPQLAAIHKQLWINECEGSDEEYPETDDYYEKATDSAGAELSYDGIMTKFRDRMQQSAVVSGLSGFFDVSFTGSCPVYSANVWVFDITFDQWCSPQVPWGLIQGIVIATALFASARIAFT